MDKFNRNYSLLIEGVQKKFLTLTPPFTLEFDINRNILSSLNVASLRIYNLSQDHRNQLRRNEYDFGTFRQLTLSAGYGDNLPIIFDGSISHAWSVRAGVNFITQIECYDGGFAQVNGKTNETVPKGTPYKETVKKFAKQLPYVNAGKIGDIQGKSTRATSYSGATVDILRDLTQGAFFIDNKKAHALKDNEVFQGDIQIINSDSGLLGTPLLEETFLKFDMIFEPRLLIGQKVTLQSSTDSKLNGDYKVISVKHQGTISDAICGDAKTTVGLAFGIEALKVVVS